MQYQWYSCIFGQYNVTIVNEYLHSYTRSPRRFLAIFSDTQLKKIILFKRIQFDIISLYRRKS